MGSSRIDSLHKSRFGELTMVVVSHPTHCFIANWPVVGLCQRVNDVGRRLPLLFLRVQLKLVVVFCWPRLTKEVLGMKKAWFYATENNNTKGLKGTIPRARNHRLGFS